MAPLPVLTSAADLISRIEAASKQYLGLSVDLKNKISELTEQLSELTKQLSDHKLVEERLRMEIKDLNSAAIQNPKSTAVLEYKLSESDKKVERKLACWNRNGLSQFFTPI
ncbi:hypothetical protein HI914_03482 [Erysiphe necator]|nr:hypothetical protein HI914_03482 [Erysiphe necator]